MQALEFLTTINNGLIKLPKIYAIWENTRVRVIVLAEQPINIETKKQNLRDIFAKMQQIELFKSIDDPSAWQKKLRDDWDDFKGIDEQVFVRDIDDLKL